MLVTSIKVILRFFHNHPLKTSVRDKSVESKKKIKARQGICPCGCWQCQYLTPYTNIKLQRHARTLDYARRSMVAYSYRWHMRFLCLQTSYRSPHPSKKAKRT